MSTIIDLAAAALMLPLLVAGYALGVLAWAVLLTVAVVARLCGQTE